mmetsp:Transcript_53999/g.128691  ORF Transcript_53999/g.128691 Transcript_53999/m.128691 type:complete len:88 (+) Transcript_53999:2-265(+)
MPRERDRAFDDSDSEEELDDGNVVIDDDYIDKVTTLRANARFMKFMRENHHDEVFAPAKTGESVQKVPEYKEDVVLEDEFEDYCNVH